ncbi:hypothetical protein QG516_07990 [Pedobacter gandavensis]|uniref:hypothetical protein n=1 Tax=Pedobacter gandavensis TaxID=2679963 RepID=UPI0024784141|nr:hypothetical protein [Pedobacter gandavensis]WGQ11591.1 hypothetical protein QG516_07990 [Pedobacter gandavensis]
MKPRHLFTSMLAVTTIVVASCSAPRYAQQGAQADDVYNSNVKAQIYTPQPKVVAQQEYYDSNDEYYGTSDPYYDMDYSSRINRFSYASPWRSYYDPYFDGGFGYGGYGYGGGLSLGLSFGSAWGNPYYGWGGGFGYNPWYPGWGSGFYPGWGGGFYPGWGGGFYPGWGGSIIIGGGNRYNNAPRPSRTMNDRNYANGSSSRGSGNMRSDRNGNVISRGSRADSYLPNRTQGVGQAPGSIRPGRVQSTDQQVRPARESYRPQQNVPTYTPSRGGDAGGRSSGGGSVGGGGGRSSRGGRG